MLHDPIRRWAEATPDAPALHHGDRTITFAELAERSARAAWVLAELALPDGRIAVIGENHPAWIEAFHGASMAGRTLVFLNHRLAPAELRSILGRSGAAAVVGPAEQLERLGTDLPTLDLGQWAAALDEAAPVPGAAAASDPDAVAWLIYTSGTTGAPKGAMLTHASLDAAVAATGAARPVAPDEVYLFPFALCHVAAYNVLRVHEAGRPVVLVPRFDPAEVVAACAAHRVTSMSLAATMLSTLLDHLEETGAALPTVTSIAYGAAPMPVPLLRRVDEVLGVDLNQGYGMTELSGNAVFLDAADHRRGLAGDERVLAAAGRAAPGVEVRLDPDSDEILVRAPQVMVGYWEDPAATEAALGGGWLHTGDVGRLDPDGLLTVVDRLKDVIVTGGENVSSLEVEAVLRTHHAVQDVAVVGVPDPTWGENVCAVVVVADAEPPTAAELSAHARRSLAGFKAPRHVVVVEELPVNAAGKVRKAELRARFAADPSRLGERA